MKKALVLIALAALAAPVLAAELAYTSPMPLTYAGPLGDAQTRATVVYDDTTTVTAGFAQAPGAQIGDELLMTAGGILDTCSFSVFNSSATAPLTSADLTLKFYNLVGTTYVLAGQLAYTNVALNLNAGGYYSTFNVTGIAGSNISLGTTVLATLTISNVVGGSTSVGQVLANPPAVGSSTDDFFYNGSWYWFNGNPVANFYWQIGVVPEPASMLLLGLAGLLIRRR
jgi:hypothetical protein